MRKARINPATVVKLHIAARVSDPRSGIVLLMIQCMSYVIVGRANRFGKQAALAAVKNRKKVID